MKQGVRISLNLQPSMGNKTGIGMYTYEIARRLQDDDSIELQGEIFNFLGRHNSEELRKDYNFNIRIFKWMPFGIYRRLCKFLPIPYSWLFPSADIRHFFNYIVPPYVKGKVITTIYDLVYLRYPETMKKETYDYLKKGMEDSVQRSDVIITISEFVKQEIIELLHVPEEKVKVVYLGPSITESECSIHEVREKFGIKDQPYLLYVGSIEPRKNLVRLIQAYNQLRSKMGVSYQLVLAGGKGWNNEDIYREASQSPYCKDIIFTGYVTNEEKTTLYKHAKLFLFPSIYEGFGIPILEAMQLGVPVVTADAASMPEVAADGAELVDPFDVDDIADGMNKVLLDEDYSSLLIERGYERVKQFDWEKSAKQIRAIYAGLM